MISVLIPARNERWLSKTVDDIYRQFTGRFEVIVVFDGPTSYPPPVERPGLVHLHTSIAEGIRPALNRAATVAEGDYILKADAHCAFGPGFDEILLKDIQDNEILVARRFTLDLEKWEPAPRRVDYYYLSCPWTHPTAFMMQSCPWITRTEERANLITDDLMCFQGSMWLMSRKHWESLGGLETNMEYAEHHELSMKTWFSGGRVAVNKNTWYAHPAGGTRGYRMDMERVYQDHDASARRWVEQPGFSGLVERFWPLPTADDHHRIEKYVWPADWRKYL